MKLFSILALSVMSALADEPKLEFDEFNAKMALEFGHIIKGEYRTPQTDPTSLDGISLNRNIIMLEQDGRYGDAWEFNAGLKAIMWWPFVNELGPPSTRTVRVMPQVSVLKARLYLGEQKQFFADLGYFPYKYNHDAKNLGEYLYRSGTYPGEVKTSDGFRLMDDSYYDTYGLHLHLSSFGGVLNQELNFFTETTVDPVGDVTPAYELSADFSFIQLGVGAAYNRGFAYRPSQSQPNDPGNMYIESDTLKGVPYYKGPLPGAPSAVSADSSNYKVLHTWTQRGIKLMGRVALNFGFLLPESLRNPDDLKVYSEIAVLGWENQPYYYEKRSERTPIMFGVNIPTFKLLNVLSLEGEYYDSQFNDTYNLYVNGLPTWGVVDYENKDHLKYSPSKWRWSAYASKAINKALNVHLQVASDHMRLRDDLSMPTEYEVMLYPKNWYYLVQLEAGI
jgi:hypothetical protein